MPEHLKITQRDSMTWTTVNLTNLLETLQLTLLLSTILSPRATTHTTSLIIMTWATKVLNENILLSEKKVEAGQEATKENTPSDFAHKVPISIPEEIWSLRVSNSHSHSQDIMIWHQNKRTVMGVSSKRPRQASREKEWPESLKVKLMTTDIFHNDSAILSLWEHLQEKTKKTL